jgi:hypothetical protein
MVMGKPRDRNNNGKAVSPKGFALSQWREAIREEQNEIGLKLEPRLLHFFWISFYWQFPARVKLEELEVEWLELIALVEEPPSSLPWMD